MKRRNFLKNGLLTSIGIGIAGKSAFGAGLNVDETASADEFTLPKLPYAYDALEPFVDRMTMEIHHSKHHQAYVSNLNKALSGKEKTWTSLEDLCKKIGSFNSDSIRNNAGGHYNHSFFWEIMQPATTSQPDANTQNAINATFGSLNQLREAFNDAAMKRFGSGWAWLVMDNQGKLLIGSTPNQDNPLMDISTFKGKPILALDVWEHAYYLKYQNRRKEYIDAWWNLVNWNKVSQLMR
jgi:Fe-Mn family superoxide dismutase